MQSYQYQRSKSVLIQEKRIPKGVSCPLKANKLIIPVGDKNKSQGKRNDKVNIVALYKYVVILAKEVLQHKNLKQIIFYMKQLSIKNTDMYLTCGKLLTEITS